MVDQCGEGVTPRSFNAGHVGNETGYSCTRFPWVIVRIFVLDLVEFEELPSVGGKSVGFMFPDILGCHVQRVSLEVSLGILNPQKPPICQI